MAKVYVTPKVSIEAGPQIGFLLNSKKQVDIHLNLILEEEEIKVFLFLLKD